MIFQNALILVEAKDIPMVGDAVLVLVTLALSVVVIILKLYLEIHWRKHSLFKTVSILWYEIINTMKK